MTFEVLFVCTGNVCRSPTAELLANAWTPWDSGVRSHSAGLAALVDQPMSRNSAAELTRLGVDPGPHRGRQFEPWMAVDVDLVLTAEQSHADKILRLVPQVFRQVFTMREFARLVDDLEPPGDLAHAVPSVAARRGRVAAVEPGADDIADPYRRSPERARDAANDIAAAVRSTIDFLVSGAPAAATVRRRPLPYPR